MKQKIFYYFKDKKVIVKPLLDKTKYQFKMNDKEIFILELPLSDTFMTREIVNNYIIKLSLN